MFYESYAENLILFVENVSYFYAFCALISFAAVGFTWWIEPKCSCIDFPQENKINESADPSSCSSGVTSLNESFRSNKIDKKSLIENVERSLTNDDLVKENQVEKQQLMEIFELMKKDEKFNINTMEELEEQLRLYRK